MPRRSHDRLIQEPRIRRAVRRVAVPSVPAVPLPRVGEEPVPRTPDRDEQVDHQERRGA